MPASPHAPVNDCCLSFAQPKLARRSAYPLDLTRALFETRYGLITSDAKKGLALSLY